MRINMMLLISLLSLSLSAETIGEYELEILHSYQIGNQDNEFAIQSFDFGDIFMGPTSINIAVNGLFAVYDKWNESIKIFNSFDWNLVDRIDVEFPLYNSSLDYIGIDFTSEWIFLTARMNSFIAASKENIIEIDLDNYPRLSSEDFIYLSNVIFFIDESNQFWSLFLDGTGDYSIFDPEQTEKILEERNWSEINNVVFENGYIIINGGNLLTRDYFTFFHYWNSYYGDIYKSMDEHNWIGIPNLNAVDDIDYIGDDIAGNNYWEFGNTAIFVTNQYGILVDIFKILNNGSILSRPTIHPNGDIYYLGSKDGFFHIYRIPNTWAPFDWQPPVEDANTNSTATVTANGLRMRDNPATTNSNVVASLEQGTTVEIIGQSATEETIGGNTNFWYRVRTSEGLNGWVFGAFLDMEP